VPSELWQVPADGGSEELVVQHLANNGSFAVSKGGVYFIPPLDAKGETHLMFLDLRTGAKRRIAQVEGTPMWGLAASPDGRFLLNVSMNQRQSDLMLAENFH
jgi:hypothetical protein